MPGPIKLISGRANLQLGEKIADYLGVSLTKTEFTDTVALRTVGEQDFIIFIGSENFTVFNRDCRITSFLILPYHFADRNLFFALIRVRLTGAENIIRNGQNKCKYKHINKGISTVFMA